MSFAEPRRAGRLAEAVGVIVLLLAPVLTGPYYLLVLDHALAVGLACVSVNLLLGYTGMLSLGHAAFFGIGAYTGAFLFTFGDVMSLEVYLLAGTVTAAALAGLVGAVCVRTTRIHFTILTLTFAQMVHSLFVSGAAFRPFGETGKGFFLIGSGGLYIPRLTMAGRDVAAEAFSVAFHYVVVLAFLGSLACLRRIVRSPFGLALRGIRDSETRTLCIGIPVRAYRWRAFVVSGLFAGLAGGLDGQLNRQVTPQLDWPTSAQLVVASVLGGTGSFYGPIAGALAVVALNETALRFALYHGLILGVMLVVVVRVVPDGLAGTTAQALAAWRRWRP